MRDAITTWLDVLGLLLVAAGVGLLVGGPVRPGLGVIAAGVVVLGGSALAARARKARSS